MRIKTDGQVDHWCNFGLMITEGGYVLSNNACLTDDYIKLFLRTISIERAYGVHSCNFHRERPVLYLPFYINDYKLEAER